MDDLWFEEELIPSQSTVSETIKSFHQEGDDSNEAELQNMARGVLRYSKPRWRELDPKTSNLLSSGATSRFVLVRFGFEFDLSKEGRESGSRFTYARCAAYLSGVDENEPQPSVYDLIPKDLYEGEPRKVQVKVGPEIKLGAADVQLGEVSTDFTIGYVEPVVVGWPGEGGREPYWELRPQTKSLLGVRHLWAIIEIPEGCTDVQVAVQSEAEVSTPLFRPILIAPKKREWANRPREVLGLIKV